MSEFVHLKKWESKVIASHVAEFDIPTQPPAPPAHMTQQHHHPYPPHPIHIMQPHYAPAPYAAMQAPAQGIKAEPMDNRFMLQYAIPPLPGPSINGARPAAMPPHPGGQTGVLSFSRPQPIAQTALVRPYTPQVNNQSQQQAAPAPAPNAPAAPQVQAQQQQHKIPQVDGPSESSGDEDTPSPPGYAPRTSHPSLPQPSSSRDAAEDDSEAINSDLDDPDTENEEEAEEGGPGETDIVFCTYDKVRSFAPFLLWVIDDPGLGRSCQEQVEVCAQGWNGPC